MSFQVVGPPGTGKTDVAVQIISNIYHNFPEQRTLIVTHSNQVTYCTSSYALIDDDSSLLKMCESAEGIYCLCSDLTINRVTVIFKLKSQLPFASGAPPSVFNHKVIYCCFTPVEICQKKLTAKRV